MELSIAKEKFICDWGRICTDWGINRSMGQVHALLLISKGELCADDIIDALKISRGSANMSLRALEEWTLIYKMHKTGDRRDFYQAEKNPSKILKRIIEIRKKKELDPLMELLENVNSVVPRCPESDEFCKVTRSIQQYAKKADTAFNTMTSGQVDWLSYMFGR